MLRVGIDVGGTNTDAVLMEGTRLVSYCKTPTTDDVGTGIVKAMTGLLSSQPSSVRGRIAAVMIGTTQFTNAVIERRGLVQTGILRLSAPAARGVPPLAGWPSDFVEAIGRHTCIVRGGYQFDGRENSPLDELAAARAARDMRAAGVRAVAICGMFSPLNPSMEERAAAIFAEEAPDIDITLSSRIGRIGLLERENAAAVNASLSSLAKRVVTAFRGALAELDMNVPFFISQNDGTLVTHESASRYPVLTIASGPTNSMRGAALMSGIENALVADIGGTTTDVGMLVNGYPRESSVMVDVGGVRTNFRMPDLVSVGLGGGTHVVEAHDGIKIGPRSVGYRLTTDARVFGGAHLTTTDIAVAAGYAAVGERGRVENLSPALVEGAVARIHEIFTDAVDRMKTNSDPVPLVLVGGGAVLINRDIEGVSRVIVPEAAAVANAVGASIAQVGGEVDRVWFYEQTAREKALEEAVAEARANAVRECAVADTIRVVEIEELPLQYMHGSAVRVRVKVVGDLDLDRGGKWVSKEEKQA
jgi:N-methylhydantoinase A/oxoprolinase/acetone carboxylase beta subunit